MALCAKFVELRCRIQKLFENTMGRTFLFGCYVAVYRCAIIIQIMCYAVKGVKFSHYIRNFKRQISTNAEKILYLLGHWMKKNQRHKNLCQHGTNYFSK